MKILLVHNRYQQRGGEDSVFDAELELLSGHGNDVVPLLVTNDDVRGAVAKLRVASGTIYSPFGVRRVRQEIRAHRPDVMHVHNYFPRLSPYIFREAHRQQVPTVHTLHNYRPICPSANLLVDGVINESSIEKSAFHMVGKRVYRGSYLGTAVVAAMVEFHKWRATWQRDVDAFVALTEFARSKFVQAGFPQARIHVKPNFLPNSKLAGLPASRQAERREGALFVGRLSSEKGITTLLEAWREIDYPLTLAGGGATEEMQRSAPPHAVFVGELPREHILELMHGAAFLVMPSEWYEGFPVTLVEAYMCGLPVVASDIGSLGELVVHQATGLKFSPGDPDALRVAVRQMLALGDDGRAKLGAYARKIAQERYSEEKNLSRLIEIYEKAQRVFWGGSG